MKEQDKPSVFSRAMKVRQGRICFVVALLFMAVCFCFSYFIPYGRFTVVAMAISGAVSVFCCQQFGRVLSAIRWQDRENPEI